MTDRESVAEGWVLEFDTHALTRTLITSGTACIDVERSGDGWVRVWLRTPYDRHVLLEAGSAQSSVSLFTGPVTSNVYCRVQGRSCRISNVSGNLMDAGEEIAVDTFPLVQQLLGANYPIDSLFPDIPKLEASAHYRIAEGALRYVSTTLLPVNGVKLGDVLEEAYAACESVFGGGEPISVLLSGGYDSRLNLALARRVSRRHGNALRLWHAYKNDAECSLTQAVAHRAGMPLHVARWEQFHQAEAELIGNPAFIKFQSGPYRDNLPRWHAYLGAIQAETGGCSILGLGAEAHKGKFYDQIHTLDDAERILGADAMKVRFLAARMKLPCVHDHYQGRFFADLRERADVYPDWAAVVDFIHYHSYVSNGYGKRCHDLSQWFAVPFPFLSTRFLSLVFSLPERDKKGFNIVKRGLAELAPEMLALPFVSANAKSLGDGPGAPWYRNRRYGTSVDRLRMLKWRYWPAPRKGGVDPGGGDPGRLDLGSPRSHLTATLKRVIDSGLENVPFVRARYCLQALLYFNLMERERDVAFRAV